MDFNYDNPAVRTATTRIQRDLVAEMPSTLPFEPDSMSEEIDILSAIGNVGRTPSVPIYELKADEEARQKLKSHKEDAEYEALVAKVKEWEALLADKGELDHRALAVLLDDKIMFDELKRSHKLLDDTYAYITKETNKWEEHEAMYDALLANIKDESDKCEEARQMLSKLM